MNFRYRVIAVVLWGATLSACGEQKNEMGLADAPLASEALAAKTVAAAEVEVEVVVDAPRFSSSTVGSQGGTLRLTDKIGAVYSIAFRDGGAWLQGVALLRGADRGWYNQGADKVPQALKNLGVGGSLGPHMVLVAAKADGVWIDDKLFVSLQDQNVVLFDGAGETPLKVGLATLDSYLGPAPLDDAKQRRALVRQRLRVLLTNSKSIKALWAGG